MTRIGNFLTFGVRFRYAGVGTEFHAETDTGILLLTEKLPQRDRQSARLAEHTRIAPERTYDG